MTGERTDGLEAVAEARVLPLVTLGSVEEAVLVGEALAEAGISAVEVALRTPAGIEAIREIATRTDLVVGAGTVLTAEQVERSVDAGARFIVSPGLDESVAERCAHAGMSFIPGVATATEVQRALSFGLDHVKLFPAAQVGGAAVVRAFAGPFPTVRFMPSGGVTAENAPDYLALGSVFAVSGTWMVPASAIAGRDATRIVELCLAARQLVGEAH